jgi:Ras-related GTP-binding protein C/D
MLSKIYIATDSSPVDIQSYELCSDMIDVVLDVSSIYHHSFSHTSQTVSSSDGIVETTSPSIQDSPEAHSIIKLNNGMVLYLKEVNKYVFSFSCCFLNAKTFNS